MDEILAWRDLPKIPMSVNFLYTIWCEHNGADGVADCFAWMHSDGKNVRQVRSDAKAAGWQRRNNKDICPDHKGENDGDGQSQ